MIVAGIDPSLVSTGVAIIRDPESGPPLPELHSVRSVHEGAGYDHAAARITRIRNEVMALVRDADLVVMEAPAFATSNGKTLERYWLWGKLYDALMALGIPRATMPPATLSAAPRSRSATSTSAPSAA